MKHLLLFTLLYVVPAVACLIHTKALYSSKGRLGNLTASSRDYAFALMPLFNIALSVILWVQNYPLKSRTV